MPNLFAKLPEKTTAEFIETLVNTPTVRVERIASFGHASPPGFWYDQPQDEWVTVLRGTATLGWDDGRQAQLLPGDWHLIPARTRHRVDHTDPDTLWLAVHLPATDETR